MTHSKKTTPATRRMSVVSGASPTKETHVFMNQDPNTNTLPNANKIVAAQMTTANLNTYIANMSNFDNLKDAQVFEQIYKHEGDIGAGIDRISTLVSESFKGVITTKVGPEMDAKELECFTQAKLIYDMMRVENLSEAYTEIIMKDGNLFIDYRDVLHPSILPYQFITFIPDLKYKNSGSATLFTDPKYMLLNERTDPKLPSEVIDREDYIHVKYKDTPVMAFDNLGRQTFGIYSISPLHRCIIPVWWKRTMLMIDTLIRSKLIPREHHKILSDIFSLDNYSGTPEQQKAAQAADVQLFINTYINTIKNQAVDQGYVTLDTVDIEMINAEIKYTEPNDLLKQIQGDIYTGLNVPSSIVNGKDAGSYASELVVSNYVSSKVLQIAKKIKFVILKMIKDRLLKLDSTYPVDIIDIKLELVLAMNRLESFRQLSLMVAAGVFTEDEIRAAVAYEMLTDEQRKHIVSTGKLSIGDTMKNGEVENEPTSPSGPSIGKSAENVSANETKIEDITDSPDTERSKQSRIRDPSEEILRDK